MSRARIRREEWCTILTSCAVRLEPTDEARKRAIALLRRAGHLNEVDLIALQDDRLLEVEVVARRLKKCPESIRRWIRAGLLAAQRAAVGATRRGNYLIAESDLRAFVADSRNILRLRRKSTDAADQ